MSEGEKKPSGAALPKEAQVMAAILRDLGITDYDPGVLTQLLEYSYRYVTTVLEDAKMYSAHARKKTIDVEDVKLAVEMQLEQNNTAPPTREILMELAHVRNNTQLPLVKPGAGLRLPPDRHCLTATNYRLRSSRGGGGQSAAGGGSGGQSAARGGGGGLSAAGGGVAGGSAGGGARKTNGLTAPTFNIQVDPSVKRKWDEAN